MKKLLLELGILLVSVAIVMGALNWYYRDFVTPVDNMFLTINTVSKETHTLLAGNSHMGVMDHNLYLDSNAINISMGGQDVFHQLLIFQYALEKLPKLNLVVMNIDYEMVGGNLVSANQSYIDRQYYPYTKTIYDNSFGNRLAASSSFFRSNRDLRYIFQHSKMQEEFKTTGKDLNFIPNENPTPELCKKRAIELTKTKFGKEQVYESMQPLHDIIKLAKEKNITLVLISTPRRPCFKEYMSKENMDYAHARLDSFFKGEAVPFYDYFSDTDFTDDDFRDPDHMNGNGELKFSIKLKKLIKLP